MGRAWQELFADGRLAVRPPRAWSRLVSRATRRGELVRLLPGVYCPAGMERDLRTRCAAVLESDPNAIITGAAAAALTWWPECPVPEVAAYRRRPVPAKGFRWLSDPAPEDLVLRGGSFGIAAPALAVLDMLPGAGGEVIDEALRRKAVTLAQLEEAFALTPYRPGNVERRWLLDDSRDEPWSELERAFHRVVRDLDLPTPYRTNFRVELGNGGVAFIDVALPVLRLGFEVDGYEFHGSRGAFERDRVRDARLAAGQWWVVRLSWEMVEDEPELVVAVMRSMVATRMAELGLRAA